VIFERAAGLCEQRLNSSSSRSYANRGRPEHGSRIAGEITPFAPKSHRGVPHLNPRSERKRLRRSHNARRRR
jgi:hypothetical protein